MITNFFSSTKGGAEGEDIVKIDLTGAESRTSLKEDFTGMTSRKASKSMQVVQPQFMNFLKPIDIQEVSKIKTLSSGLTILNAIHENNDLNIGGFHRKQKSSINEL